MANDYPDDPDGLALRRLAAAGAEISEPMDIDFFVAAADEATARHVANRAAELGYETSIYSDDEGQCDPWTCVCTKWMVPTYPSVIAAQAELDAIARPLGAYTDGWSTFGGCEKGATSEVGPESTTSTRHRRWFQYSLNPRLAPKPGPGSHARKSVRRFQFSLAELIAFTTIFSVGLSMLKWFPEGWPLVVAVGVFVAALYLDRHHSLNPRTTLVVVIVALVLIGVLLPMFLSRMR